MTCGRSVVFSNYNTDCHNITEKLWTVALISHILHTVTFKYCYILTECRTAFQHLWYTDTSYILTECRTASQHSLVIQSVFTAGSLFYTKLMPIKQRLVCTCKFSQRFDEESRCILKHYWLWCYLREMPIDRRIEWY